VVRSVPVALRIQAKQRLNLRQLKTELLRPLDELNAFQRVTPVAATDPYGLDGWSSSFSRW
jgi:hypothetical protein